MYSEIGAIPDLSQCGLACSAGSEVYGLTEGEQNMVDLFKVLGSTLCFIAIIFLVINQYVDQKRGGKKFCDKPILQIIPYLITLSLFLIVALMTVGEIIGKETIMCLDHEYGDYDEEILEFSFFNPTYGKNGGCTVHGILFYGVLITYEFYTVLLSFVIFRQLYRPMSPLWNIRQRYWHILVITVVIIFVICALIMSVFGGIYPMGVCLPGPGNKNHLLILMVIPLIFSSAASFLLLLASGVLLKKEISKQQQIVNKDSSNRIQDLLNRLIFYGIGVLACLILILVTAIQFYSESDNLSDSMNDSIQCQLTKIIFDPTTICPDRSSKMSPFFFISWILAAILGVGSQIVLSCHNEARNRLKRAATLKDVGIGSKLKSLRDKTKSKSGSNKDNTDDHELPSSPKSTSQMNGDFSSGNNGTITVTPCAPIERINSEDEDDPIGDIGDIELTVRSTTAADQTINDNDTDDITIKYAK